MDLTAAEAALEEVDATAFDDGDDDEEQEAGLATAETTVVERAATHRACAMPRDVMVGVGASGVGVKGGRCSGGGAAEARESEGAIRFSHLKIESETSFFCPEFF